MPDMKGITVKIPVELHAEVKAYLEAHNMTTGQFREPWPSKCRTVCFSV